MYTTYTYMSMCLCVSMRACMRACDCTDTYICRDIQFLD